MKDNHFTIVHQDGERTEFPMPLSGWLRIEIWEGGAKKVGTYSSSEIRSLELPAWRAPAPMEPPKLVEREFDQSVYDSDGRRHGPYRSFRAMQHDDESGPETPKPRRKKGAAA